jgi:hypothetical protein
MKNEIDKYFYCSANFTDDPQYCPILCDGEKCEDCQCYHRKHPTPEQYKEEYGEEVPDDMAVWFVDSDTEESGDYWELELYGHITRYPEQIGAIVIACTPFGCPDDDWRPE